MTGLGAVSVEPQPLDPARPGMPRGAALRSVAIVALGTGALIASLADWESPIRTAVGLAFLLLGPGLALGELLAIDDLPLRLAIATGASLAVDTLVATALVYAGRFSAELALVILVALTLVAVLMAWIRPPHEQTAASEDAPETS